MALNYETLIRAASKSPGQRTTTEINDFIFPWLKQSLKKKQGIFQKISDDVIQDICKTIILERRPAWDVVIHQGDPGDTFYIILQGSVNIYRFDEDGPKPAELNFDTVTEFAKLNHDPDKREEIIAQTFGNYIVTLEGNGLAYSKLGGFDFGERALVTNEPRSATVMTITPTDLLVVGREVFNRTLKAAHEKELQEKTDFINRCPLFCSWSPRLKRLVSLSLERGRFSYDSVLYKQGACADAVYFIWSGEVKLTMDPLLHWLQYPYVLPHSDQMKQRALELFAPLMQPAQPSNVHVPTSLNNDIPSESFVIKRRHMTFAEAEKERASRIIQLALLSLGDIIGLESYVCDLATHMNTARCTASCDLFYILKHNFLRLHKRHGAQGLSERLRETVLLSLQAYPPRVMQLPLFTSLMKRQLAPPMTDEQAQWNAKQSWLLQNNNGTNQPNSRRSGKKLHGNSKNHSVNGTSDSRTSRHLSQPPRYENALAIKYVVSDQVHVEKLEDRLKEWHAQIGKDAKAEAGKDTKAQIRPLTRYNIPDITSSQLMSTPRKEKHRSHQNASVRRTNSSSKKRRTVETFEHAVSNIENEYGESTPTVDSNKPASPKVSLPLLQIYSKKEQYDDMRANLKMAWKKFNKRPVPSHN